MELWPVHISAPNKYDFSISGQTFSGGLALIRITGARVMVIPPDPSAAPFCSGVYGVDDSNVSPSCLIQVSNLFPRVRSLSE